MSLVGFKGKNHPQQTARHGPSDQVDDRGTPADLFNEWSARFGGFTLDVAAAPHNAKCDRFFTIDDNGIERSWKGERVWCNPPYSDIGAWVRKAHAESKHCPIIVMLLPANRTEQVWWQDHIEPYRLGGVIDVEFLRGRIRFHRGDRPVGPNERPPFGCCLVVWDWGVK